jgi:hypothetical protein
VVKNLRENSSQRNQNSSHSAQKHLQLPRVRDKFAVEQPRKEVAEEFQRDPSRVIERQVNTPSR